MSVTIWTRKENGTAAQQSIFIRGQAGLTDGKDDHVVPVSGLGDEAYFRFDNTTSFWWRMDDDYVIHLYVSDYPIGWEAFYDLALQVDRSEVIS
ncbi:MAG: hypothetical protein GWN30_09650 [Gammaproteobacteria bacterium]|nr:hypothetical protein [Gammaproteobacteria bacterium]